MNKKNKKYFLWILSFALLLLLSVSFIFINTSQKPAENQVLDNIKTNIIMSRHDINTDIEPLSIDLDEVADEECVIENIDCIEDCFTDMEDDECFDEYDLCEDACDDEFPIDDELITCWDGCDETGVTCIADCDTDECIDICDDEWDICSDTCDEDYLGCCDDCADETIPPCLNDIVDCVYDCLGSCEAGQETSEWDDSEVTDMGNFYETHFPEFSGQFETICEWVIGGDLVSTEEKYGCNDIMFFGGWFAPFLHSIESFEVVCDTIGGSWIETDDEISCNLV